MSDAFNIPEKIKLSTGEEVELPKLSLKKIKQVTGAVAKLMQALKEQDPTLFDGAELDKNPENMGLKILSAIPSILPTVVDETIQVAAVYLGKDQDWIEDNLDLEDLGKVIIPFFVHTLKQGNNLYGLIVAASK